MKSSRVLLCHLYNDLLLWGSVLELLKQTFEAPMATSVVDPLAYAADADPATLEEIARLDSLRVRILNGLFKSQVSNFFL